jgi:dTDP-4-amino-4,6-dideoxygalactose transaminase
MRFHGSHDKRTHTDVGYNSRLDAIQAAALRVLLPELDGWNQRRRAAADAYAAAGLGELVRLPEPTAGAEHVYHLYTVRADNPDELIARLAEHDVQARAHYRVPAHRQPGMARFAGADLPVTDELAQTNVALPMGPELDAGQVAEVVDACRQRVSA